MSKLALLVLCCLTACAEDAPRWARDLFDAKAPDYPSKVDTVVLLYEQRVAVSNDGARTTRERGAIRIIRPHRGSVGAVSYYNQRNSKLRDFHAWVLPPAGKDFPMRPESIVDAASSPNETYNEGRLRAVNYDTSAAAAGTVFAWEYVLDEKSVFTYDAFPFQGSSPTLTARYVLSLPPGWEASGTVLNHAPVQPSVAGNEYTWELTNLPWIEQEEDAPSSALMFPRLGVRFFPPDDAKGGMVTLRDWLAVSRWLTGLADPVAEVTPAIQEKSSGLTAGAATEAEKLARIAAFAQKVNYVSVQMNLLRGGGFTPHRAEFTLSRNYGDCKDKATLMRSLLKAAGIDSYLTLASADDRFRVRKEWPVPQFNHAIVAVRVSAGTNFPSVLEDPKLGRVLFFDPTDEFTPLGGLPVEEQGSPMLVLAGEGGELVNAPLLDPALSRVESEVTAELMPDRQLRSRLTRHYFGQSAGYMRSVMARDGSDEARKVFERSLTQRLGGLEVREVKPEDHPESRVLDMKVTFDVAHFGQVQGKLVLLRPGMLVPGSRYSFAARERKLPVQLFAESRSDRVYLVLPPTLKPDEIPDPVNIESRYGKYTGGYVVNEGGLMFQQKLEVVDSMVPAAEYGSLREFFDQIAGYQQSVLVLTQK